METADRHFTSKPNSDGLSGKSAHHGASIHRRGFFNRGQRQQRYGAAALQRAVAAVASAQTGSRNEVLNREGYSIGRLVGADVIAEADAGEQLIDAGLAAGLSTSEARCTVTSALRAGISNPRVVLDSAMSLVELEQERQRAEAAREKAAADRLRREAAAADRAAKIWGDCSPATPEHAYLKAKQVPPLSARQRGSQLVLPITEPVSGQMTSLQFIGQDGQKKLLSGGRKRGCVIQVAGETEKANRVLIAEGWATGVSLSSLEGDAVVLSAIDASNLSPVATTFRRLWPNKELIICADADNRGIAEGRSAAIAAGALMAVPEFPTGVNGSDWNDYINAGLMEHSVLHGASLGEGKS